MEDKLKKVLELCKEFNVKKITIDRDDCEVEFFVHTPVNPTAPIVNYSTPATPVPLTNELIPKENPFR